jgi:uncharacterized membrane protein YfcA
MIEPWQMAALAAVGLAGGTLGGFLGIGGAVIFIPMMKILLGADPHTVIATTLVLTVCVGASSAVGHFRAGRVDRGMVKVLVPPAVVMALVGVWVGNRFSGESSVWLWRLFGAFLVYVAIDNVRRMRRPPSPEPAPGAPTAARPPLAATGAVGAVVGFLAGLLGIGGGAFAVPLQQVFLKQRLRTAIANSSVLMIVPCAVAAVEKHLTLGALGVDPVRPWLYVALLAPAAMLGAFVGSHVVHRVPLRWVRGVFVVFLVWTAWKMLAG